eukprot:11157391-Alexandrium_andersonii.AAC.1
MCIRDSARGPHCLIADFRGPPGIADFWRMFRTSPPTPPPLHRPSLTREGRRTKGLAPGIHWKAAAGESGQDGALRAIWLAHRALQREGAWRLF